jgi:hypothetical protein
MGIQNGQEMARQVVTGTLTAPGEHGDTFTPDVLGSVSGHPLTKFTASLWAATLSGPVTLERSYDGGANWVGALGGIYGGYSEIYEEAEPGVLYRFTAETSFTGGPLTYRISQ